MKRLILFVLLCLSFISCSKSNKTPVKISLSMTTQNLSGVSGGLVVFGKNLTSNDSFVRVLSSSQTSIEEELTRGQWELGAMGWGGSDPFTGKVLCAQQASANVSSGPVTFDLNLNNESCFNSIISPEVGSTDLENGGKKYASIYGMHFCGTDLSSVSSPCTYEIGSATNNKTTVGSYLIELTGERNYKGQQDVLFNERLQSYCFKPDTNMSATGKSVSLLNIPRFLEGKGLSFRVVAHMSEDCSETTDIGAISIRFSDPLQFKSISPMYYEKRFFAKITHDQICTISNQIGASGTFASGTGETSSPYLICNRSQLYNLQRKYLMTNNYQKSYLLGADIELLDGIKAGTVAEPFDSCLEAGDTFLPFGYYFDGECEIGSGNEMNRFSGNFDGNNKAIKNFRFRLELSNSFPLGLFPTVSGGKIMNLRLEKVEIEGGVETGALAGIVDGSSALIKNIKVSDIHLRGAGQSGGLIGDFSNGVAEDLHIDKARLRAEGDQFGGIIGIASGAALQRLSFDGIIDIEHHGNPFSSIGGIIGEAGLSQPLSEAVSSGAISGIAFKVGGIAGKSAGTLNYVRSDMLLYDRSDAPSSTARNFGGIVGDGGAAGVDRSFFLGKIYSFCIGGACNIGNIAGSTLGTGNYMYSRSTLGLGGSDGSISTNLNSASTFSSTICASVSETCNWSNTLSNDFPRLSFENHPCHNLDNNKPISQQKVSPLNRGVATNPIIICRADQLAGLSSISSSDYVKVAHHLDLSELSGSLSSNLQIAMLDGQNKIFHSYSASDTTGGALFDQIANGSVLKNIQLRSFHLNSSCSTTPCRFGALARVNNGQLLNIKVHDTKMIDLIGNASIGGLVSDNGATGKIFEAESGVNILGLNYLGGIAARNYGQIENAFSHASINEGTGTTPVSFVGGIVGQQDSGSIKKAEFNGNLNSLAADSKVGGLAGVIRGGSLTDSLVGRYAKTELSSANSSTGGLVGVLSNTISSPTIARLIFDGNLYFHGATLPSTVSALFGETNSITRTYVHNYKPLFQELKTEVPVNLGSTDTADICTITVEMSTFDDNSIPSSPSVPGALRIMSMDRFYQGDLSRVGTKLYSLSFPLGNINDCEGLSASGIPISLYKGTGITSTTAVADLKTIQGFDIATLADSDQRLYRFFFATLKGIVSPVSAPTWEFDDEEGLRIFRID